jgi:hypothetical protein
MPDNELHQFWFTWSEIDLIRRLIRNNAEFEEDEETGFRELANKIEDQIVNHNDND